MAIFELEQRFTPLIECQPVWQPWGLAGRYTLDEEGNVASSGPGTGLPAGAAKSSPAGSANKRAHSWGGYAPRAMLRRFGMADEDEEEEGAAGEGELDEEEDNTLAICAGQTDEEEEEHGWGSYFNEQNDGHGRGRISESHLHDLVEEDDEQIALNWNMLSADTVQKGEESFRLGGCFRKGAVYASMGQYSEGQVDKACQDFQFCSEWTEADTMYPSESSCSPVGYRSEGQLSSFSPMRSQSSFGGYFSEQPSPLSHAHYSSEASTGRRERRKRRSKAKVLAASAATTASGEITTLMVQNLPYSLAREEFLAEMDRSGFADQYNFCHVPRVFKTGKNQGFAFVNFVSQEVADRFAECWHGSRSVLGLSSHCKSVRVKVATVQGIEACEKIAQSKKMQRVKTGTFKPLVIGEAAAIECASEEA